MTISEVRRAVNLPAWMESHPLHRPVRRPHCTILEQHAEDLQQSVCDRVEEAEKPLKARTDPASLNLHAEFIRWHGSPIGEYTTFFSWVMVASKPERD